MFKLFKYIKGKYWLYFAASIASLVLQVWLDLTIPAYMSEITKLVKTEGTEVSLIWSAGGMMLLCAGGSVLAAIVTGYLSSRFASTLSMALRAKVFNKVEGFSMEEIDDFSTASLITRSTNDITQIQNFVSRGMQMVIRAPIMAGIALYRISTEHLEWTAFTGGMVLLVLIVIVTVVLNARPRFQKMQVLTDDLNRVTRENLTGIRVIRAYNAEEYQEEKFEGANERLTSNSLSAQRIMSIMQPTMQLINNLLTIGIYCIGGFLIAGAGSSAAQLVLFSEMVVFSTYAAKIVQAFMSIRMILMMLPRATVSAGRLNEVLDRKPDIIEGNESEGMTNVFGEVEFKNVSFKYPGSRDYVLKNVSFKAHKGETVAFIGATGSGKTSLVNLIMRFYDTTEGEVLVDGRNVREYSGTALRAKLGYAPQKAVLFTGTVRSNVAYGKTEENCDENVIRALKTAQAYDFVSGMQGGLDAPISRGGTNVSGGQKQRISIARAIFKKPEIYIFDDTFSALDYKTDTTLRSALKTENAGVTSLIVAQRIGTIRDADRIIVLEDGAVAGIGTHRELLQSCKVYKQIAKTQLSTEEIENG